MVRPGQVGADVLDCFAWAGCRRVQLEIDGQPENLWQLEFAGASDRVVYAESLHPYANATRERPHCGL